MEQGPEKSGCFCNLLRWSVGRHGLLRYRCTHSRQRLSAWQSAVVLIAFWGESVDCGDGVPEVCGFASNSERLQPGVTVKRGVGLLFGEMWAMDAGLLLRCQTPMKGGVRKAVGRDTTHQIKQPRSKRSPPHIKTIGLQGDSDRPTAKTNPPPPVPRDPKVLIDRGRKLLKESAWGAAVKV